MPRIHLSSTLRTFARHTCAAVAGLSLLAAASAGIASPSLADSAGSSMTDATGAEPLIPAAGAGGIGSSEITDAVASGITNSTTCTPAEGKETPVLLIHGTTANSSYMLPIAKALHERGYCVWAPTYGQGGNGFPGLVPEAGGLQDINASAQELDTYIDEILRISGSDAIDLLGHSQSGLVAHVYMQKFGGAKKVRRAVSMGGSFHGTDLSGFATVLRPLIDSAPEFWDVILDTSTEQQIVGSQLLREMAQLPETTAGVSYTALSLPRDTTVTPGNSTTLEAVPGADVANVNVDLACLAAPRIHHTDMPTSQHTIALAIWGLERAEGDHTPAPGQHCTL